MNLTQLLIEQFPFRTHCQWDTPGIAGEAGCVYLYLLSSPFVSEPGSAVCTNPASLGNRRPLRGKLLRKKISNASRIWGKKILSLCANKPSSHALQQGRRQREHERQKERPAGWKQERSLGLQRKCLHSRDSEG